MRAEIGSRLKDERERLGLSQSAFAALGGVSRRAEIDWETGKTPPNGEFLAIVAAHGVDVLYVLTGTRSVPLESTLTKEEEALLDNYRHSAPEDQAVVRRTATALAESKKLASRNGSTG